MFFLKWEDINDLLGKHPELKEYLKSYDFQKIRAEENKAIEALNFESFCKLRSKLEKLLETIGTYQEKKGYTNFEAMSSAKRQEIIDKFEQGLETENSGQKMSEEEFDVNNLKMLISVEKIALEKCYIEAGKH